MTYDVPRATLQPIDGDVCNAETMKNNHPNNTVGFLRIWSFSVLGKLQRGMIVILFLIHNIICQPLHHLTVDRAAFDIDTYLAKFLTYHSDITLSLLSTVIKVELRWWSVREQKKGNNNTGSVSHLLDHSLLPGEFSLPAEPLRLPKDMTEIRLNTQGCVSACMYTSTWSRFVCLAKLLGAVLHIFICNVSLA